MDASFKTRLFGGFDREDVVTYIEKTADLPLAVKRIMDSKTFDYGTICASEQSVVCDDDMAEAVQKEMEKQGAYFLSDEDCNKSKLRRCTG